MFRIPHPYDDALLSFGEMKEMIEQVSTNQIPLYEKFDGLNLMVSYKDGKLIGARNKTHMREAYGKDENSSVITKDNIVDQFKEHVPDRIKRSFRTSMESLEEVIKQNISENQLEMIFRDGRYFYNVEIVKENGTNIIPYSKDAIVFHGKLVIDEDGNISKIKNPDVDSFVDYLKENNTEYDILAPTKVDVNFDDYQGYIKTIESLQEMYKLDGDNDVSDYFRKIFEIKMDTILGKYSVDLNREIIDGFLERWSTGVKSKSLDDLAVYVNNENLKDELKYFDKHKVDECRREIIRPIVNIMSGFGNDILENTRSTLIEDPETAKTSLKENVREKINKINEIEDEQNYNRFLEEKERFDKMGGLDHVPLIEGVVFKYGGIREYKLTGMFGPINKMVGIFKYNR